MAARLRRVDVALLEPVLLGLILIAAALLRFYWLGGSSLWSDEGNTWALVQRSVGRIAQDAAADIHPPGYYWALKLWTGIFGVSAAGLRSFSAAAGVALVFVVYRLGCAADDARHVRWSALLAAWFAALNPFQIYYSQEARMYMLLSLEAALLFWALFALVRQPVHAPDGRRRWLTLPAVAFVVAGGAGLWTHYSFPIVLAAAGLAFLIDWFWLADGLRRRSIRDLAYFALLNGLIVLSFLPWLPTATDRVLNWPQGGDVVSLVDGLTLTLRTLLFGPLGSVPEPLWPWLVAAGLLPLLGAVAWRNRRLLPALALWLAAPVGLMFALGLFSDAFLKFLLVATAPWCLLCAAAGDLIRPRWPLRAALALFALAAAALALPSYYGSTTARDNYAGVAAYIAALGDPARDLVLLNAPGQQEVWDYYDPGLETLALPAARPPDRTATEERLAAATAGKRRVYALFWAADEADPEGVVEAWLDAHAFRGVESWQGNLRFVIYALPQEDLTATVLDPPVVFGDLMALGEWRSSVASVAAGDTLPIALVWRGLAEMEMRYKVSVQLLDGARQVVAQSDSEPAGGSRPTSDWTPGEEILDKHGLYLPPGTPPAPYRLFVTVYDAVTGERLTTPQGDAVELGEVHVTLPAAPPPLEIIDMARRTDLTMGPVTLAGYDQHKLGFAHVPQTPLSPGDTVEFILYWQAPDPLPIDWPPAQTFTLTLGEQQLISPLAGPSLPTAGWSPGQVIRVTVQLPYDGSAQRAVLAVDGSETMLAPLAK